MNFPEPKCSFHVVFWSSLSLTFVLQKWHLSFLLYFSNFMAPACQKGAWNLNCWPTLFSLCCFWYCELFFQLCNWQLFSVSLLYPTFLQLLVLHTFYRHLSPDYNRPRYTLQLHLFLNIPMHWLELFGCLWNRVVSLECSGVVVEEGGSLSDLQHSAKKTFIVNLEGLWKLCLLQGSIFHTGNISVHLPERNMDKEFHYHTPRIPSKLCGSTGVKIYSVT